VLGDPATRVRDHAYHAYLKRQHLGQAIRTERYRMVQWTHRETGETEFELYDYVEDPLETKNLASIRVDVLEELKAILASHPKAKPQAPRPNRKD
jgi:iduronate 2-sulfatase